MNKQSLLYKEMVISMHEVHRPVKMSQRMKEMKSFSDAENGTTLAEVQLAKALIL